LRSGDSERLRDLHFAFFLDLARRAEPELQKADQVLWLNRLQLEHDNLRSALDWALSGSRQDDHAQELAAALWWFWTKRGYFTEGRDWLQRALALDRRQSPRLRIKILVGLVLMMSFAGNFADRGAVDGELAALARDSEDLWAVALARFARTGMAIQSEELPTDSTPAGQLAVESHAAAVAAGDLWLESVGLMFLGLCAMFGGDYDRASLLYDQCVERCRPTGDKWLLSIGLHNAAVVRVRQGQCAQADVLAAEAILLNRELSEHRGTAWCLEAFADSAAAQGQYVRAARLWGASDALLESVDSRLSPAQRSSRDSYLPRVIETLGEAAFQSAQAEGHAMSLNQAVQYALKTE
jgi:non-specific serine/threonine protein kinase